MAWKKDLAKLKQDLGKEETPPARTAPPRPKPAHSAPGSIEEEDDLFLSAMGMRPKASRPARPLSAPAALAQDAPPAPLRPQPAAPGAGKGEFGSAMEDLKGLKPLKGGLKDRVEAPAAPAPAPQPPAAEEPAAGGPGAAVPPPPAETPAPVPLPPAVPAEETQPARPAQPPQVQIHLAAGMAVPVDGSLDLKGHARSDAEERLKERILDGYALGWRTLHVLTGPSEELRQMILDLLGSKAGDCVARYAQAPIPMGGSQAWILYFR